MTLLGPLTATARPSSCSSDTKLYGIERSTGVGYGVLGPTDTISCMPPGYTVGASNYYYPASSCPYGYTTACDPIPTFVVEDNTVNTQFAYTCCPTQQLFSCMTSPSIVWQSTLGCTFQPPDPWSTTITSVYLDGSTQVIWLEFTTTTQDGYGAYAIQLRAPMPTTSLSSSSSNSLDIVTTAGTIYAFGTANASGQYSGDGGGGNGLSSGAAAGVGIAVALAAIGAGLWTFLAWRRRRRRARDGRPKMETREEEEEEEVAVDHTSSSRSKTVLEMGNKEPDQPEMSGQGVRRLVTRQHEVDGLGVAELSG